MDHLQLYKNYFYRRKDPCNDLLYQEVGGGGGGWEIGLKRKTCSSVNSDTSREIIISVHNGSLFNAASGDEVLGEVIRRHLMFCTMFRVMIRK